MPPRIVKAGACQVCDPERPTTCVFGGKGRKRFEFMRLEDETKDELLQEERAWEFLEPWGFTPVSRPSCSQLTLRTTVISSAGSSIHSVPAGRTSSVKAESPWLAMPCT